MGHVPPETRQSEETYIPCRVISTGFGDYWKAIQFKSDFPRSGVYYDPSSGTHKLWVKNSCVREVGGSTEVRARPSASGKAERVEIFDIARQRHAEFGINQ